MPGQRYTVDDLKLIANSPLCIRPERLPALEEWMGPPATPRPPAARQASNIKSTTEDIVQDDSKGTTPKRPLFGLSRTNTTEDIVLGPPKMAFASASVHSRKVNNDNDPSEKGHNNHTTSIDDDKESPKAERFSLNRFGMQNNNNNNNRDKGERNGNYDRNNDRDQRGQRRGNQRVDSDGWTNVTRPLRKSFGVEEGEKFRRGEDRIDKEGYKDFKDRPPKYETFNKTERDPERPDRLKRRDTQRRDESSWFLPDDVRAARNAEKEREFREQREQRGERDFRNGRGDKEFRDRDREDNNRERENYGERQYQRGDNRVEKDPEWLDAAPEEPVDPRAHSMEEFQRWKERMKAGNAAEESKPDMVAAKEASPVDDEIVFSSKNARKEQKVAEKIEAAKEKSIGTNHINNEAPPTPAAENNVDRYFNIWNTSEKTPAATSKPVENAFFDQPLIQEKTSMAGATGRASKFKSFFNAPAPAAEEPVTQQQTSEAKADEIGRAPSTDDQAGFQRILGMLGRAKISSPANSNSSNQPPAPNPLLGLLNGPNFVQSKTPPAQLPFLPTNGHSGRSSISQNHQSSSKGLLDNPPQNNGPQGARDANSEFLLKLMRQADHPTPQGPPPPTFLQGFGQSQMPLPPNISEMPFQKGHRQNNTFQNDDPSSQNFARTRQESNRGSISIDHQRSASIEQRGNHMDLRPPPGIEPRAISLEQRILLEQRNGSIDRSGLMLDRGLPMDLRNMPPMEHRGLPQSESRGPPLEQRGPPLDPRGLPMGVHMDSGTPPWLAAQNQQGNTNAAPRPPPGFYGRPGPNNLPATGMNMPPPPFFGPGLGNIPPPFAQSGMPPPPNLQNLPPNFPPFGLGAPPGGFPPPFPPMHDGMMVGHPFPLRPDAGLRSPPHQQQTGGPPGMFTGR